MQAALEILPWVLVGALVVYIILVLLVYRLGERIAFPAPKASYVLDERAGFVRLETREGVPIAGLWLENPQAQHTLLYSHGNGEDIGEILPLLKDFHARGFSVMAYDYTGYGRSGGKPGEQGLYAAADAAWDFLTADKKIPEMDIALIGCSMGGSAACYLAQKYTARAMVLVWAFASPLEAVFAFNFVPWHKWLNNRARIARARCPVYLLHGTRDGVTRFSNSVKLHAAAREPKYFARVRGAGHYDIAEKSPERYWDGIRRFIGTLEAENSDY